MASQMSSVIHLINKNVSRVAVPNRIESNLTLNRIESFSAPNRPSPVIPHEKQAAKPCDWKSPTEFLASTDHTVSRLQCIWALTENNLARSGRSASSLRTMRNFCRYVYCSLKSDVSPHFYNIVFTISTRVTTTENRKLRLLQLTVLNNSHKSADG